MFSLSVSENEPPKKLTVISPARSVETISMMNSTRHRRFVLALALVALVLLSAAAGG